MLLWGVANGTLEHALRQLVSNYVAGQISFREFDDSLALATWEPCEDESEVQDLVYDVELLIAEFTSHHRSEADLRSELARVLGGVLDVRMSTPAHGTYAWLPTISGHQVLLSRPQAGASNEVRREAVPA